MVGWSAMCERRFIAAAGMAALIALGSCNRSDSAAEQRKKITPPAPSRLAVFLDNQPVATLQAQELEAWPRLDTVVPVAARRLGTWTVIKLVGSTTTEVRTPSATYPDLVPAVFPGLDGQPAFGMFDPVELAKHGKATVRYDRVGEVRIARATNTGRGENDQSEGGARDPSQIRLSVKTKAGTTVIEGTKLLAIPRDNVPGTKDPKGWTLRTILTTAGVTTFGKLVLSDARGTALNIDKTAFDPNSSIPYVKLNRQGLLRLRIFKKQGANWNPTGGDLREFVAIEVVK